MKTYLCMIYLCFFFQFDIAQVQATNISHESLAPETEFNVLNSAEIKVFGNLSPSVSFLNQDRQIPIKACGY